MRLAMPGLPLGFLLGFEAELKESKRCASQKRVRPFVPMLDSGSVYETTHQMMALPYDAVVLC